MAWWRLRSACAGCTCTRLCFGGFQDGEAAHERIINRHEGARIIEFSTVVGSREHRDQLPSTEELVSVLDNLVGSTNKVNVILLQELFNHGLSERIADTSIIFSPAALGFLGVRPQQVAQKTILRHLSGSRNLLQLGHGDELGRKTSMHAKNLVVDKGCDWHAVKYVLEFLPDADTVSPLAFVVESVNPVDLAAFVVASE